MKKKSSNAYPVEPRVGVGAITIRDGKVLLVKRGTEPSKGLWAIPGGTLKLGESMQECAAREIFEETGITIKVRDCKYVFDFIEYDSKRKIKFHFVIVDFAADYVAGVPHGADDALEARWFSLKDLRELPVAINTINALKSVGFFKSD
ncbi:MAG: NUDIX hydrolase [Deltaproteobacteria bacterium HGW-Deltaproteobacteria-2]|jgi:ADP-ribose pyrophosphatase|nr:MAG: NUDIX hydrolase [Deltaproteobacteria bacterium HGW-Deltaproteobacteria-2]